MRSFRTILCILGAFIGAGFASGREVMRFFTQYGTLSVPLILLTGCLISWVMRRALCGGITSADMRLPEKAILLLLFLAAGGGMTAAAGELWALTIPLRHARSMGMLFSLGGCMAASSRPERAMTVLGYLLLPVLLLALTLCMRTPASPEMPFPASGAWDAAQAVAGCFAYAGMNGMLALGIMEKAGRDCSRRRNCRCAVWAGGAVTALLLLCNRALLPHAAALRDEPLPLVVLLRVYGTEGYYLAAALLYLAVITTLIAVLRGMRDRMARILPRFSCLVTGLAVATVSLCGFERIVAVAYPVLGLLCFWLFAGKKRERRTAAL